MSTREGRVGSRLSVFLFPPNKQNAASHSLGSLPLKPEVCRKCCVTSSGIWREEEGREAEGGRKKRSKKGKRFRKNEEPTLSLSKSSQNTASFSLKLSKREAPHVISTLALAK